MSKSKVIAIDGPSGSGKSTIAKIISEELQLTYLDTGALYRAIAYTLSQKKISPEETDKIKIALDGLDFSYGKSDKELVTIDGENLTYKIREHNISRLASIYSKLPVVRDYLKSFQRDFAKTNPSVLEGRDIGTVIFPDAALKVFLTADSEVRAKRRFEQLVDMGQKEVNLEKILDDIKSRDNSDRSRDIAPLKKAEDAVEINTSGKDINEVTQMIKDLYLNTPSFFPQ